ncbi:MAG: winged helix-turn-helix transcriptional regulator [Anaerolineae bacterium]|nr:winged helix-turn-helix transcriptional regulator [Anaerolineae bacterium]
MTNLSSQDRDLVLLEQIEKNPNATQATLAEQLGVAVGTVNWHLKRLIEKGYVKVKHAERRKLKYIITPEGIALRANLTVDFIRSSMEMYRLIRQRMKSALQELQQQQASVVRLQGGSPDVVDICRLSCLESGIHITEQRDHYPVIQIDHLKIIVHWQDGAHRINE